jgi:hypothetical protein
MSVLARVLSQFPRGCCRARSLLKDCVVTTAPAEENLQDIVFIETFSGARILTVPGSWTMTRVMLELTRVKTGLFRLLLPGMRAGAPQPPCT